MNPTVRKYLLLPLLFLALFLAVRYVLPLIFPFLLGAALAWTAEPAVRFGCHKLHIPRSVASGIGVTLSFCILSVLLVLLTALAVHQLRLLATVFPDLSDTVLSAIQALSERLTKLTEQAPAEIAPLLDRSISQLFSGSSALLEQVGAALLRAASGIIRQVPGRALSFGTAIIASFMISAKLPQLQRFFRSKIDLERFQSCFQTLRRLRRSLWAWLKAQLKLSAVTFGVAAAGLLLLRVPHGPVWAFLIALVDAFPILGTGAVLVPWSLISFLQGDHRLAFGLLGLYGAAAVTRSILEPRFIGKHLGLDPLVTLIALYIGFKLMGLPGMILSPLLAVTLTQLMSRHSDGPGEQPVF